MLIQFIKCRNHCFAKIFFFPQDKLIILEKHINSFHKGFTHDSANFAYIPPRKKIMYKLIYKIHKDVKQYRYKLCNISALQAYHRRLHISIHKTIKLFQCKCCDYSNTAADDMKTLSEIMQCVDQATPAFNNFFLSCALFCFFLRCGHT